MFNRKKDVDRDEQVKVGDKHPPKHTQFKKGDPGGPGRPRIPKLQEGGQDSYAENIEVLRNKLVMALFKKAMDGHFQSIQYFLKMLESESNTATGFEV